MPPEGNLLAIVPVPALEMAVCNANAQTQPGSPSFTGLGAGQITVNLWVFFKFFPHVTKLLPKKLVFEVPVKKL